MTTQQVLRKIRDLLTKGFSLTEIRDICFYELEFREVYESLEETDDKSKVIRLLIDYAARKEKLGVLLERIREKNPGKYKTYAPYFENSQLFKSTGPVTSSTNTPQDIPAHSRPVANERSTDFVIITALEEERDAVLDKLPGYQQRNPTDSDIRVYYQASIPAKFPDGSSGDYRAILMSLLGMGRVQATISTADAIRRWQPRYVMMVGIAGGVAEAEVKLGDVLISDQIVDYELQKLKPEGPQIRWEVHRSSPRLREVVRSFRPAGWRRLIKISRPAYGESKRHIGPIASGDKVIASNEALKVLRTHWPKLIGVEMEGGGVAVASFQATRPIEFLMVRGVSDLADEQKGTPEVDSWRTYACDVAAAYAIGLLQSGPVSPSIHRDLDSDDEIAPPGDSMSRSKAEERPNIVTTDKKEFTAGDAKIESPYGGMMSPDSRFYVEREADRECWQELNTSQPPPLYIQAPKQMGKSSMMYRLINRAKTENRYEFAFVSFQMFPEQYLKDAALFFKEFCRLLSRRLGVTEAVEEYWADLSSNIMKCSEYVSQYLVPKLDKPVIVALDELERLLDSPFRSDFFGMLRSWHTRRFEVGNFTRLILFLISSTDPYLLIPNPHQSPFNVARRIVLADFTLDQVNELNRRHNAPLNSHQVHELMALLEGHPYLTRLAFYLLQTHTIDLDTLLSQATADDGPFGDHLSYYYRRIVQEPKLMAALNDIYHSQTCKEKQLFYRFQQAGLVKLFNKKVMLRNKLYRRYFKERLL